MSAFQREGPHLSSPGERAFVILDCDGDCAIVKGAWTGFRVWTPPNGATRMIPGNPGRLDVELFDLRAHTSHKFHVPRYKSLETTG